MLNESIKQQDDPAKKGKVLFVVLFIIFSFFFNKTIGPFYPFLENSFILAAIYATIALWGFLWILSFKVNAKIVFLILPQVVFLVFTQILFLDMFFEQAFGRLYETFLMVSLLIVFFIIIHITFLTCNVFAVSSFKKIPLESVGKTMIYIVTVLSIFFAIYGFLNLGASLFLSVPLLLFFVFFVTVFLLSHFFIELSTIFSNAFMIFWCVTLVVLGSLFLSSKVEFVALIGTMVFYYSVGLFINKREQISSFKIVEYLFVLFLLVLFAIYFSFF